MTNRIWVQVGDSDRRVPIEGRKGAYLARDQSHNVRLTPFIQRRINEGDLQKVDAPVEQTASAAVNQVPLVAANLAAPGAATAAAAIPAVTSGTTTPAASATSGTASEKGA